MPRMPPAPSVRWASVAAPVGGINYVSAGGVMPELDAMAVYNMVAAENGLRVRLGSREWCTGLTGAADDSVRTIIPYSGSASSGAANRVFATTSTGIWDVSASSNAPTQVLAFVSSAGDAGWGIHYAGVSSAGAHSLYYADDENGLFLYTESTDTWAAVAMGGGAGQIANVDPANLKFAMSFKSRMWFVEEDSQSAWYLATGDITGAATRFPFAAQAKHGGELIGLWNWTHDGGSGIDDSLVAAFRGGDVAVYVGTDPSTLSGMALKGVWNVGAFPEGRDIGLHLGGDLLLLTRTGLRSMSELVTGNADSSQYPSAKVGPLLNSLMLTEADSRGWSMRLSPQDNTLLVTLPGASATDGEQLAFSIGGKSWSRYRNLPINCCAAAEGRLYYGTTDGKVGIHDGYVDGVTLADPDSYTAIQWAVLTAFRDVAQGATVQGQMVRTKLRSTTQHPAFKVEARFGYDDTEIATVTNSAAGGTNAYDTAIYDTAVYGGEFSGSSTLQGISGMGSAMALACRGAALTRTVLVGWDLAYTAGGFI